MKEVKLMELLQLRYFCDAAETQNFSKTATKFNVPASNISQCIKRLEDELEIKLFTRSANKVTLSECGKHFYEKIKTALTTIDSAKESISSVSEKTIKVCVSSSRRIIMSAIEKFRRLNPDVLIEISNGKPIEGESYDLIITGEKLSNSSLKHKLIASEGISLAINKDNILSLKKEITKEDLSSQQFISMNKESNMHNTMKKICNEIGFEPQIIIHCDDPFYVRKCVESGLGITFIPEISWKGQFSDTVIIKKIQNFSRNIYAYWNSNTDNKEYIDSFLSVLEQEFRLAKKEI